MNENLARIDWRMGQALLPEHLIAQEESLLADVNMKFRLRGLPFHGVGVLKITEPLLKEGIFAVQELAALMISGTLLAYPGNTLLAPFNLNAPGTTKVALYLHLLSVPVVSASDAPTETGSVHVSRKFYQTVLSASQDLPDVAESFKMAEFTKSPEGIWQIAMDYVPPLFQVGASPFFRNELRSLADSLANFQYSLYMDSMSYLSGDSLTTVKQCLKSVYIVQRLLANISGDVFRPHPFYLYEELLRLYTEVCFYRGMAPENVTAAYPYNNPAAIYQIIAFLEKQIQMVKNLPPYIPFLLKDNIYSVTLPEEVRKANSIYLLVQKNQVTRKMSLADVKLASYSRLSFVHKMALKGVPLRRLDHPHFRHAFGAEVEFYQISEGEEWDYALSEMKAAFYDRPELAEANFFIFWRIE